MTEQECLALMKPPGAVKPTAYGKGVIQIILTSQCNLACYNCTQCSQLQRPAWYMTPEQFEQAVLSLKNYWGVIGVFGGNPAMSKHFVECCAILRKHWPKERSGLWCNDLLTAEKGQAARQTFNPAVSNLNCHMSKEAYTRFKAWWPESSPFGHDRDSRHSPPFVAMKDVLRKNCPQCGGGGKVHLLDRETDEYEYVDCLDCKGIGKVYDESLAWELISNCDVNQRWSAMIGVFRGQLRAWFCEVAGAQAMLHQWDRTPMVEEIVKLDKDGIGTLIQEGKVSEYTYPDTGCAIPAKTDIPEINKRFGPPTPWWQRPMSAFSNQVRQHCHSCSVPLRGHGELAMAEDGKEQVSETHKDVYKPKRVGRRVELVTVREQLGSPLSEMTKYLQNASK